MGDKALLEEDRAGAERPGASLDVAAPQPTLLSLRS